MAIFKINKIFISIIFCIITQGNLFSQNDYKMLINYHGLEKELELNYSSNQTNQNAILINSIYLNRDFLKKPKEIRKYLDIHENLKTTLKIKTHGNNDIYGELFDRGGDTLLVIGEGFPTPHEQMVPFLELFPNYDILFIDYFGQGLNHTPSTLLGKLTYHLFNVDMNATKLGSSDEVDVINFVKAAIKESSLFEKLLIDGCWPSIKLVIKKIARDPSLICGKQPPSSPCPFITHRESFQNGACSLVEKLAHIKLSEIQSIEDKIQFLKIPILFFQSAKDCYCTEKQFENIWQSVSSDKIAILTPHFHGRNYLKDAITFQKTSHIFFEHPVQDFMSILLNS